MKRAKPVRPGDVSAMMTMGAAMIGLVSALMPGIEGQVLLDDGKPAAKAFLVLQTFHQGEGRLWSERVDCDEQGRFSIPEQSPIRHQIYAFSSDLKQSVIEPVSNLEQFKTIRLKPSADVTLKFKVLGDPAEGSVHLSLAQTLSLPWVGDMDNKGEVRLWMPQGKYFVGVRSDECDFPQEKLTLTAGPQTVTYSGEPNPFRKLRGQPAPDLQVLDTLGVAKTVSLKDYRGKHVLLEFWGYWCGPCVESSIPGLIKLKKDNPDLESKLVILAVHENSGGGRSLKLIREHLPKFERDYWGGPLPFPIIVEKPESLTKTFGIRAYPTAVLIDPEGKVVDRADPASLKSLLGLR